MTDLLAIGGAHLDRRAQLKGAHRPGSSNPAVMMEEIGGGAFNALRTARKWGLDCALLSARGGDLVGQAVMAELERTGIRDLSATHLDRSTASYTALLSSTGDLVTAIADMDIYETALPRSLARSHVKTAIENARMVLCDANLPTDALERIIAIRGDRPTVAMAISAAKAPRLIPLVHRLECLALNRFEALSILGQPSDAPLPLGDIAAALAKLGCRRFFISDGPDGCLVFEEGRIERLQSPKVDQVVDVTGAGDALAGTVFAGLLKGEPMIDWVRRGLDVAAHVVSVKGCAPDFDPDDLARMRKHA